MSKTVKPQVIKHIKIETGTSIDTRRPKLSSMNKHKKRSFKAYRGQGRP